MNVVRAALPVVAGTELIPERAEVYYINKKYFSHATAFVKRYARRSPYMFHAEGTVLRTLGSNVTVHYDLYEFLHNEYRRSFVEWTVKLCDVLTKSPWKDLIGGTLVAHGFVCPVVPGTYKLVNLTISLTGFPDLVPFEKAKAECFARMEPTQEILARARFFASFKKTLPKG